MFTFDQIIGGIEDGIKAALAAAVGVKVENGYAKTIESYAGELDADTLKRALGELTPRMPLFLVAYGDGDDSLDPPTQAALRGEPRHFRHDCTFTVICCSDDARGDRARRRGTGNSAGVYKMISDARTTVGGVQFAGTYGDETWILNSEPMRFAGNQYLARLPELTAYAVHFDTWFRYSEPDRTEPGQLVEEVVFEVENTFEKGDSNLPGVSLR
jgi:uncharacterized protein DUF1834